MNNELETKTLKELEAEANAIKNQFRYAAAAAFSAVFTGAIFYHYIEDFTWVNSFYFCVVSLATVGYGDIVPKTDSGKIFTIFYILVGISILAAFGNALMRRSVSQSELRQARRRARQSQSK